MSPETHKWFLRPGCGSGSCERWAGSPGDYHYHDNKNNDNDPLMVHLRIIIIMMIMAIDNDNDDDGHDHDNKNNYNDGLMVHRQLDPVRHPRVLFSIPGGRLVLRPCHLLARLFHPYALFSVLSNCR